MSPSRITWPPRNPILTAAAAGLAISLTLATASLAAASPTPNQGPISGGTVVILDVPLQDFTELSAGAGFVLTAAADGSAWTWGDNAKGQLGTGNNNSSSSVPVKAAALSSLDFIQATAGRMNAAVLAADGSIWTWGWNSVGQLGNGSTSDANLPTQVPGLSGVGQIAAAEDTVFALSADGTVWGWGANSKGQLGPNVSGNTTVPVQIPGLAGIKQIAAGGEHLLTLAQAGEVLAMGSNSYGQLGVTIVRVPVACQCPWPACKG